MNRTQICWVCQTERSVFGHLLYTPKALGIVEQQHILCAFTKRAIFLELRCIFVAVAEESDVTPMITDAASHGLHGKHILTVDLFTREQVCSN